MLDVGDTLDNVIHTTQYHYIVPDARAALDPLVRYHVPQRVLHNVSAVALLSEMAALEEMAQPDDDAADPLARRRFWREQGHRTVHFGGVPDALKEALESEDESENSQLYASDDDEKRARQFMWLSSPSVRTHTHFDSDRNSFVQLLGTKRFFLWHPRQTPLLCPFPRLHPLWHKSRADFEAPDLTIIPCANYSSSEALTVDVGPGDVLYIPPFYWHTVETLTPSLSLSTISRWPALYEHLNAIYRYDYLWDELKE